MMHPAEFLKGVASVYPFYRELNTNERRGSSQASSRAFLDEGLAHRLASIAMDMKLATAQYAMYLSFEQRARLFAELDYLLNVDGWEPSDSVPNVKPYINFLKWLVETKHLGWSSLGFDADGNLLCAFFSGAGTVTASFLAEPIVLWSSAFRSEDGDEIAAGQSPLRAFVQTGNALLAKLYGP
jgi:hypothetical protein